MSKRQDFELLCDIKEAIQRVSTYIGELSYDDTRVQISRYLTTRD